MLKCGKNKLTLRVLRKICSRWHSNFFFRENNISCEWSVWQILHMKYQDLFSLKIMIKKKRKNQYGVCWSCYWCSRLRYSSSLLLILTFSFQQQKRHISQLLQSSGLHLGYVGGPCWQQLVEVVAACLHSALSSSDLYPSAREPVSLEIRLSTIPALSATAWSSRLSALYGRLLL